MGDDYADPRAVGKGLAHEGLPLPLYNLTYRIDALAGVVEVEREPGILLCRLSLAQLSRG
ncbi:MAG TPA: hypothetical protein VJA19_15675 [Pseudomonas sp.]|nr:hypothetical protein [Pseudomonas sp.]